MEERNISTGIHWTEEEQDAIRKTGKHVSYDFEKVSRLRNQYARGMSAGLLLRARVKRALMAMWRMVRLVVLWCMFFGASGLMSVSVLTWALEMRNWNMAGVFVATVMMAASWQVAVYSYHKVKGTGNAHVH